MAARFATSVLKRLVPGRAYRALKDLRYAIGNTDQLSPQDRAERIARLADPIRRRAKGWVDIFKELEKLELHVYPVYFYSPIPDTRELAAHRDRWWRETNLDVLRYDRSEEARLNRILAEMVSELGTLANSSQLKEEGLGPGYGEIEAMLLHGMIRHLKPRRVIEVGSGVSTFYTAGALAANRHDGHCGTITCVEPYPTARLKAAEWAPELIEKQVQDVDVHFFEQLGEGDVLFIDSSHTVRAGSDVNYLLLDVIPSLRKGVYVHIHDIPFPYVTPREYWLFDRLMFWQEPVLLKALLTHNDTLEIVYCCSYLYFKDRPVLEATYPRFDPTKHFPSSVWLRKTS